MVSNESVVVPAPTQFTHPASLTVSVTSAHFVHFLKWVPGPGMPPGVRYQVTYSTQRCVCPPLTPAWLSSHPCYQLAAFTGRNEFETSAMALA